MKKEKAHQSLDMTQGRPLKLIITFALPLIAGNALQQLYNMVDSIVVGKFVGNTALAAVGIAFPVVFLLSSLFLGLGMGAMVLVSQYYGGGETENLERTVDTVYTALIVGALPISIGAVLLTNPILNIMNVPPDTRQEATIYLMILMGGIVGSLGYNLNAGLLQGVGDSRTPLLFLAIACLLNIALDLFFVLVIPLGVAGVAIATIMAQAFSWLYGIYYINRKYPQLNIRPFCFQFDVTIAKQIARLGFPSGIQNAMFSFGIMMMSRLVNSYGSAYAAGFSAANKLDTFAFLPIQSIATSVTSYTGQNVGAGRLDRVSQGTRAALGLSLGFAAAGLLVIPAGPFLMRMFTDDPEVIVAGMAFINRIMPFYWMMGIMFTLNSVIRGAGDAFTPMIASVLSLWIARVPGAYLFAHLFGRDNMHFCYPAGWVVGLAIIVPYYLSGKWKNKAVTRAGSTIQE